jgi:hypothetical protein
VTSPGQIDCPVCETPAKHEPITTFNGDMVRCPNCGDYGIARKLDLNRLRQLQLDERRKVLDRAKRLAKPGQLPKIASYMLPG